MVLTIPSAPPLPPPEFIESISADFYFIFLGIIACGPPLWDVIGSQNFDTIKRGLLTLGAGFRHPARVCFVYGLHYNHLYL